MWVQTWLHLSSRQLLKPTGSFLASYQDVSWTGKES